MKILIIGGTRFLGPAIVEAALARGHEVVLFNRGISNPDLFPDLELVKGDRNHHTDRLRGRRFDAVIDTCGYLPSQLEKSCSVLKDQVGHYLFVSTVSVYPPDLSDTLDESHPVRTLPAEELARVPSFTMRDVTFETYGALKALCEQTATRIMGGRAVHVRPGLIVGPRDRSDRFHYWPWRLDRGGDVLGPGPRDARQQLIDVRDLGEFCVTLSERRTRGVFNTTGPAGPLTTAELVAACKAVNTTPARLVWVDEAFLLEQGLDIWQIPLWVPRSDPAYRGFNGVKSDRAIEEGLKYRPLSHTCEAVLLEIRRLRAAGSWSARSQKAFERIATREAELLRAWGR